jgi:hypothetical protein
VSLASNIDEITTNLCPLWIGHAARDEVVVEMIANSMAVRAARVIITNLQPM